MRPLSLPVALMRALCCTALALALAACGGGGGGGANGPIIINNPTGTTATQGGSLATWILVGGKTKPSYSDVFLDGELNAGEAFIITQSPLTGGATYQVTVELVAGAEHFSNTWTFTVNGSTTLGDPIATLNALRAESGVSAMSTVTATVTSSTRHAGYQALENGGLTHVEPDTANALYTAYAFSDRIAAENGGAFLGNVEYEDIASNGGSPAITLLWDTVYHRVPMMRADTDMVGFGDRNTAIAAYPSAHVPADSGGSWDFATLDFAGSGVAPTTASFWPNSGTTDVPASFDNTSESPQPIGGASNPNGTTGNPSVVGPPIHVILPTSSDFTTISVSVTQK